MSNFVKGISNLTGPDPNRLFNGYRGASNSESKKKDMKKDKTHKVGICPSKEETVAFSNDVLKFIQKRLKPGGWCCYRGGGITCRLAHHQGGYRQSREPNYGVRV